MSIAPVAMHEKAAMRRGATRLSRKPLAARLAVNPQAIRNSRRVAWAWSRPRSASMDSSSGASTAREP